MAVVTGVMSSATSALSLYNLIAAQLSANPNWSRPVDPTLTGVTDSYSATTTSEVWRCTVGTATFVVVFTTDTAAVNDLRITFAEKYGAVDGCAAKRFRRIPGGGTTSPSADSASVTPGATDVVTDTDTALSSTSPNFTWCKITGAGSAFNYLFKVGNKSVTIGVVIAGANRWVHVGAFESLVTGPSDPVPIGLFSHGFNNPANANASPSATIHADGVVTRNPGLGVTAETGAFFAVLSPLHADNGIFGGTARTVGTPSQGIGAAVPRWYTKVLMAQAIIHQSRGAHATTPQTFRGYYSDLFACICGSATEPTGGGVDSVVIDGVTYYWLGGHCPGVGSATFTTGQSVFVAVRAD